MCNSFFFFFLLKLYHKIQAIWEVNLLVHEEIKLAWLLSCLIQNICPRGHAYSGARAEPNAPDAISLLGSVQQAGVGCAHEDELGGDVPTLWSSVKSCSFLQDTTGCKVTGAVFSVCKASLLHLCVCPGVTVSLPTSCSHQFCFQLMHFSAGPFDI